MRKARAGGRSQPRPTGTYGALCIVLTAQTTVDARYGSTRPPRILETTQEGSDSWWMPASVAVNEMNGFEFTLVFETESDSLTDELVDRLYGSGLDDALISERAGIGYADFSRDASSVLEAVSSAIEQIEGSGIGARVIRIEPDDIVTVSDIAQRLNRTVESIRLLVKGERGPGGFPPPAARVTGRKSRVWRWADVVAWFAHYDATLGLDPTLNYWSSLAMVNDYLRQRAYFQDSNPGAKQVRVFLAQRLGSQRIHARVVPDSRGGWRVARSVADASLSIHSSLEEAEAKACQVVLTEGGGQILVDSPSGEQILFAVEQR